jgi:glutathione synthase/RimK-type ligase-like ATP-grasp enzyme
MFSPRCEAVRRAARVVDNLHDLGAMLDASIDEVREWLTGRASPPVHVFLKAVDIIEGRGRKSTATTPQRDG